MSLSICSSSSAPGLYHRSALRHPSSLSLTRHVRSTTNLWLFRDTVCSVGLFHRRLPFTASNNAVRILRHAVSLDERRGKFEADYYNLPPEHLRRRKGERLADREDDFDRKQPGQKFQTDVKEVWFAGCHSGESFSRPASRTLSPARAS